MAQEEYFISVGDPWDFTGPDGNNIIRGTIINILNDRCMMFKANHIIEFGNLKGDVFMLLARHIDSSFSELFKVRELITVNGNLLKIQYTNSLTFKELEKNSKFVFIGSIRKKLLN